MIVVVVSESRSGDDAFFSWKRRVLIEPDSQYVSQTLWAQGAKRAVDVAIAIVLLMLTTPIILIAAVAMWLTAPGPVFFLQLRTGRLGRTFRPYKLRTMACGHVHDPTEIVPVSHPAVTPVGRILRRFKIDELPQILNVLNGEMALLGPRPTLPEQTREYDSEQSKRLLIRPGLTGLAQVNGNASVPWEERIKYDVYYVRHHGLFMDIGIVLKTILVVLLGDARFARQFDESPYASS